MSAARKPNTSNTQEETPVPEAAGTAWMSTEDKGTAELVVPRAFADSDLAEVDSWETAMSLVDAAFGLRNAGEELGSGFRMADDEVMARLVGAPLILMQWVFYPGDFGKDFVAVNAVQRHDNGSISKWIITDGGTGICDQLKEYTKRTGRNGGLGVPKGLRVSNYYIDRETKEALSKQQVREYMTIGKAMDPATTYYLDTSA